MIFRLRLLWVCMACIGSVVAQVPTTLKFPLYHQLVHSNSAKDILPRGVIKYDSTKNTAVYEQQSEVIDLSTGEGIYRIGIFDTNKKQLSPAAFTKLGVVDGPVKEEITLYLSPDNVVYHISYLLRPSTTSETLVNVIPYKLIPEGPEPKLNTPVVVNPDGQPPVEEVEKTFVQKYWVYALPILLILLTSGGGGGGGEE